MLYIYSHFGSFTRPSTINIWKFFTLRSFVCKLAAKKNSKDFKKADGLRARAFLSVRWIDKKKRFAIINTHGKFFSPPRVKIFIFSVKSIFQNAFSW